jgi:hypothetical protein
MLYHTDTVAGPLEVTGKADANPSISDLVTIYLIVYENWFI